MASESLPVDPTIAGDIEAIESHEQAIAAKKTALAAKIGDGRAVMKSPGDTVILVSLKGRLLTLPVSYASNPAKQ